MSSNLFGWRFRPRRDAVLAEASEIYGNVVAQARSVPFYAALGVPDTPEGRIELIMLHLVLVLRRLGRDGDAAAPLARAVTEAFVVDMDDSMREMGVGDMMVAKRVKKAAAGLFDRLDAYGGALAAADRERLAGSIAHHVLGQPEVAVPPHGAHAMAAYALACESALAGAATDRLRAAPAFADIPTDVKE